MENIICKKRQRSENWLEEDKHLLMDLVRERVSVIENQNTDTNTNSKKLAAWADLLCSMCKGGTRTLPQIKSQWSIIKMTKKKIKSIERKNLRQTRGGPHPSTNPENADICSWLPNEFVIDTNEFDSDEINQIGEPSQNEIKVDGINKLVNVENKSSDNDTKSAVKDVTVEIFEEIQTTRGVVSIVSAPKPLYTPSKKPERKNKTEKKTADHAETTGNTEIECRKEVHQAQMANEERKARNLDLDETLIKLKIQYYKKNF
ncbi:unnamed protein product [Parnassius apollo]|uniref:Regulatory protein zeste n=1 Tax=Parnassius apollo TaxID=110799 RepID=A0A8S3XS83_PARAO|nr:unnamed protein product [Parnassius apollo]